MNKTELLQYNFCITDCCSSCSNIYYDRDNDTCCGLVGNGDLMVKPYNKCNLFVMRSTLKNYDGSR